MTDQQHNLESDPFYPSGPWTGFFLQQQPLPPGRFWMTLHLTFAEGLIDGEGTDGVGNFSLRGTYNKDTGEVVMHKGYIGQHDVLYKGYNEGKGIWGTWNIRELLTGGYHIWPKDMPDPTMPRLEKEVDLPVEKVVLVGACC